MTSKLLKGSCHCGKIAFQVNSSCYFPFMMCHCGICRKTQGNYTPNLGADMGTLKVTGTPKSYQRIIVKEDGTEEKSPHTRFFCGDCGSHLWAFNSNWPELVHPVATAIDEPTLPTPPEFVHIMVDYKAPWVPIVQPSDSNKGSSDKVFKEYPNCSLKQWHEANAK
eukprot:Nk52_evm22s343 gene=Nk52_evmTU22s343